MGNQKNEEEKSSVTFLDVSTDLGAPLLTFNGAEYPQLRELKCFACQCEEMDLSGNEFLESLNCSMNHLVDLDLSACTSLHDIDCSFNALEQLVLPAVSDLKDIDCSDNRLESLDLSGAQDIEVIYLDGNLPLSNIIFPTQDGAPIYLATLDISETSLSPQWLLSPQCHFPCPLPGAEGDLFIVETALAQDEKSLAFLRSLGWSPVTEESEE